MNVSEVFVRRPVATTLLTIALAFFGALAYLQLPVSDLPNVDFPTISVSASLPGASPETMATAVATPLEKRFSTIASLDSMNSRSSEGSTSITLQFSLDRNIDAAAQDVQAAIAAAARQLPPDMPNPPSFRKVNPADSSVVILSMTSTTMRMSDVDAFAENTLAQRISTLPGVAQVQVFGAQKYAVRVQLDPNRLATRGLGIDEVSGAIRAGNVNLPTGTLYGQHRAYSVEATGGLEDAAAYRSLIVTYRNGAPVRLGELGRVLDSVENDKTAAWLDAGHGRGPERGILMGVYRQPGANAVAVVDAVRRLLPELRSQMPVGIELNVLYDRSQSVRASVDDVKFTLAISLALVVLVIFLFLRNARAAFIPSVAIPMSLAGTMLVMYLMGFSIDNLSLMALTLCVGFVVDDAIVMLENISRHIEEGMSPMQATFTGAREIGFTIVSMTVSLAAVFIPVLFMGGIIGRLFHEFAVTIVAAILVSGVVSLTLTPVLCSRLLRPGPGHGSVTEGGKGLVERARAMYVGSLQRVLEHRGWMMASFVASLALTGLLLVVIPKGFTSGDDTGFIVGVTEAAPDISFDAMVAKQRQAITAVAGAPNVATVAGFVGTVGPNAALSTGRLLIPLEPRNERPDAGKVLQQLRQKVNDIPGLKVFLQNVPVLRLGSFTSKSEYQYSLQDADMKELLAWVPRVVERLSQSSAVEDVTTDLILNNPKVEVAIDRDRASALGVTANQIEDALFTAYGSREVSTIYAPSDQYSVVTELEPGYQRDPSALGLLYVRADTGRLVPLDSVASLRTETGPLTISHVGQLPAATISFNVKPGKSLSDAVTAVRQAMEDLHAPATLIGSFQGTAEAFQSSLTGLGLLLLLAVATIYLVLGILYESAIHPLTILSGLPAAVLGALLTLLAFRVDLNLYSFLGLIMLIGVVKKNAIMMIDFAIEAQRSGQLDARTAITEACRLRFRPIMMTTFAALFGTLPIALAFGATGPARQPLGLAVVGGLVVSQLLTLYLTPVIYLILEERVQQRRAARAAAGAKNG